MKTNLVFAFCVSLLIGRVSFAQQLIINEVSQGPSGAKEYVELLVIGTPTCNSIPCMDIRNFIIDDNNGNHASGSGTGIAGGCVRFKNIAFWSCIPIGTIILIYNDADQNALIPPPDLSITDGNCRLVIPVSDCTLLERHTSIPSTAVAAYPTTGFTNCGSWTPVSMANGDDSFQTINATGALLHAVSWGNNNLSTIIYFAGGAGGNVAKMNNTADNNPANQANWTMVNVAGNETPGSPNNAANSNWINAMNNSCSPLLTFTSTIISSNAGCTCNGSATLNATGAIGPYTYTWLPSGGNSNTASGLCSGIYTVNATSSNGCTQTKTVNISSVSSISLSIINNSIMCNGASNGSATVIANGGTPGYSYTWAPSGGNASTANGLAAGAYTVFVKDANNCTATATVLIAQPLTVVTATPSSTNILCFGNASGTATVLANGGTPAYTYTWSPTGGNSAFANNLSVGVYTVFIRDLNNCAASATVSITQPATALTASIASSNVTCFGGINGSATITATGGTPAYSYTWSPSGNHSAITNGLVAGNYSVHVKDQNNCSTILSLSINQPAALAITVNSLVLCNSQPGVLTATVSGGVSPFIYNWNGVPGNSNTLSVTPTTTTVYTVSATDANGCATNIQNTSVTVSSLLNLSVAPNVSVCSGAAAVLSASVNNGNGNYSFMWQPGGSTGSSLTVFPVTSSQVYTVSVNDGCSSAITKTISLTSITVPPSNIISSTAKGCAPFCVTFSNTTLFSSGLIQSFQWDLGNNTSSGLYSPQQCYSNAGDYSVVLNYVTTNGCAGSETLTNYIHIDPTPKAEFETDRTEIDIYNTAIDFTNQSLGATNYTWYFNNEGTSDEINPSFTFLKEENQLILLIAENEFGCVDTVMKEIKYKYDFTFFAPNAFTPNADNLNNIFLPKGIGWNENKYELSIYDRWGEKIFSTKQCTEGWDGKVKRSEIIAETGVYVWKVSLTDTFRKYHEFMGHVLITK